MKNVHQTKQLDLIFTRDFSLGTCEFWRDQLLLKDIRDIYGVGFSDQIVSFNGKMVEAYRIHEEVERMKEHVVRLPLNTEMFRPSFLEASRKAADELRTIIQNGPPSPNDREAIFQRVRKLWSAMYPAYMLAVFLPGFWADNFRLVHGSAGETVLQAYLKHREAVEGLFEKADLFVRAMIRSVLQDRGLSASFDRLVRFSEMDAMLRGEPAPDVRALEMRARGYAIVAGELFLGKSIEELFEAHGYVYDFPDVKGIREFKGAVAYIHVPVAGTVHLVYTDEDVRSFPEGAILVSPMTAPDHLPAMKRALAFVTDEGGITCHAAIVARELKKPCIIGTKIATKVLKDGDEVEVDATKGVVRILKRG